MPLVSSSESISCFSSSCCTLAASSLSLVASKTNSLRNSFVNFRNNSASARSAGSGPSSIATSSLATTVAKVKRSTGKVPRKVPSSYNARYPLSTSFFTASYAQCPGGRSAICPQTGCAKRRSKRSTQERPFLIDLHRNNFHPSSTRNFDDQPFHKVSRELILVAPQADILRFNYCLSWFILDQKIDSC